MFHIVYKTVEPVTGRYYIGKHSTKNLSDGYQGSGRWVMLARKKGRHLVTGALAVFPTASEALAYEREAVTAETIRLPLCMNQTAGGRGSFEHIRANWSDADRERSRNNAKRNFSGPRPVGAEHAGWGKKRPDHAAQMQGAKNAFYGRTHNAETKAAITACRTSTERAATAAGNTNVRGRRWWNDGATTYMLVEEAAVARGLVPGRISWKNAAAA